MDQRITALHIAECAGGVERYLQMLLPHFVNNSQNEERRAA